MQKICSICNKPVVVTHPAQLYHPGKCFQKATQARHKKYRDKKVEANQSTK